MKTVIRLLLGVLLVVAPALAQAETCTFASGASTWSAVGTITGAGVTGCTASGDDDFVIPSGATVTVTGDITCTAATCFITVQSGGALVVAVSTARITLTLGGVAGTSGLVCATGSTCTLTGKYLSYGQTPALLDAPETTPGRYFQVGQVSDCDDDGTRTADCSAEANRVRFTYTTARYDAAAATSMNSFSNDSVGAILTGDIMCSWNPSGTPGGAPPDEGFCYEISANGVTTSPWFIEFDVRQGISGAGTNAYPLARRDVKSTTVSSTTAVTPGSRTVAVDSAFIASGEEHYYVGRWIRFSDGTDPQPFAYRIERVTDGGVGDDIITILDVRGVRDSYATGTRLWVDRGWHRGDPLLIYRPVRIASYTTCNSGANCSDAYVALNGAVTARAVKIEQVNSVQLIGASVREWKDVYIEGTDNNTTAGQTLKVVSVSNARFERTAMIGGDWNGVGGQTQHGVVIDDASDLIFNGVTFRYPGDDCFLQDNVVAASRGITVTNLRCQDKLDVTASNNMIDFGAVANTSATFRNVECVDCTSEDDASSWVFANLGGGIGSARGILVLGSNAPVGQYTGSVVEFFCEDMLVAGGGRKVNFNFNGSWTCPKATRNFVVRNLAMGAAVASGNFFLAGDGVRELQNGLFVNNTTYASTNRGIFANGRDVNFKNLALINNVLSQSNGYLVEATTCSGGCNIENVTVGWTPGFATTSGNTSGGIRTSGITAGVGSRFVRNLMFGGLRSGYFGWSLDSSTSFGNFADTSGNCWFDNTNDFSTTFASPDASNLRDRPLELIPGALTTAGGNVPGGMQARVGCGAQWDAGITRYGWIHAISKIAPENLGNLSLVK